MLGTGNSDKNKINTLSIGVGSDGLCFWSDEVEYAKDASPVLMRGVNILAGTGKRVHYGAADVEEFSLKKQIRSICSDLFGCEIPDRVVVFIEDERTVCIPSAIFVHDQSEVIFHQSNYALSPAEKIVASPSVGGVRCLFPVKIQLTETFKSIFKGSIINYLSPVQYCLLFRKGIKCRNNSMVFTRGSGTCFLTAHGADGDLLFADTLPGINDNDAVYFINTVADICGFDRFSIYPLRVDESTSDSLKQHFGSKVCV